MKKSEIKVGGHYQAKVNGSVVTVRVDSIDEVAGYTSPVRRKGPDRTLYRVTNLKTGRQTSFRSATKFRGLAPVYKTNVEEVTGRVLAGEKGLKVEAISAGIRDWAAATSAEIEAVFASGDPAAIRAAKAEIVRRATAPKAPASPVPTAKAGGKQNADPTPRAAVATAAAKATAMTSATVSAPPASTRTVSPDNPAPAADCDVICPECGAEVTIGEDETSFTCTDCGEDVDLRAHRRSPAPVPASSITLVDPNEAPAAEVRVDVSDLTHSEAEELLRPEATANRLLSEENAARIARDIATSSPTSGLAAKLTAPRRDTATSAAPHLIVEARAGTGKTTTLVGGLFRILGQNWDHPAARSPMPQQEAVWGAMGAGPRPKFVCFVAFNRSIAGELKERVPTGCDAMTMHSMGFRAVNRAFSGLKVDEYNVQGIIARLTDKDVRTLRKESPVLLKATEELVGHCKMNLAANEEILREYGYSATAAVAVGPEELSRLAAYYDVELESENGRSYRGEVFALVPRVLDECLDPAKSGAIDYNDMIWLPVALGLPVFRYDLLLVDEAQDLNRAQQELAKMAGRRLVLCGDPKQAIYGFAGADARSMSRMEEDLKATPAGCDHLYLTVTRRCGKAIVDEARSLVPDFSAHENNPAGAVTSALYPLQGPRNERKEIPYEQTYMPRVEDGNFILCRTNAPLVSQCFRFIKRGRKATIQGRDIGQGLISTVEKMKAVDVRELIMKLNDWFANEDEKERAKKFPSEAKLVALSDRFDCLMCFCGDLPASASPDKVKEKISAIFTDDKTVKGVRLSSIHKAKGLEAQRVFFLQIPEGPCPHPMAESQWEQEQELNLCYVAVTRAIEELVYVR